MVPVSRHAEPFRAIRAVGLIPRHGLP